MNARRARAILREESDWRTDRDDAAVAEAFGERAYWPLRPTDERKPRALHRAKEICQENERLAQGWIESYLCASPKRIEAVLARFDEDEPEDVGLISTPRLLFMAWLIRRIAGVQKKGKE